MIPVECVGGPLDGWVQLHPLQNFEYMHDPAWGRGYYRGSCSDGKLHWVNDGYPFKCQQ